MDVRERKVLQVYIKRLMNLIEMHYMQHGIVVRLKLLKIIGNYERIIFQFIVKPGTKVKLIFDRAHDIQTALRIPLFKPFWNHPVICLAVSMYPFQQNSLIKMLTSRAFKQSRMFLPVALGYDMKCEMFFMDLAASPHVMYGGATNSGKSVGLKCLILSLLAKNSVRQVNLILIDVGTDTMESFDGVPHLSCPIVKNIRTGLLVIGTLVEEMERRKDFTSDELRKLPALICIIDEYVSFISDAEKEGLSKALGEAVSLLLQRGRHAKIHLVLAAQNPKSKYMQADTSNITTRIAFKCDNHYTSINILGRTGAENLTGNGSMLFKSNKYPEPIQLQGAFISDDDIRHIISQIKMSHYDMENKFQISNMDEQTPEPQMPMVIASIHPSAKQREEKELADVIMWSLRCRTVSANQMQKSFHMGNKAYEIINKLCEMGLVSEKFANQPREVIVRSADDIPPETVSLLERNGYTLEQVEETLAEQEEC